MPNYVKKIFNLFDNYVMARWQRRPSTAAFWYIPEPPILKIKEDLYHYQKSSTAPRYFIDYRGKTNFKCENSQGIIVLPYDHPIGKQINPEAAFQYALGLHDLYCTTQDKSYLKRFFHYAEYFANAQTAEGFWEYEFDWFSSKAPWYSALAQARGASVMLRALLHSKDESYRHIIQKALRRFNQPTHQGGFLHLFSPANVYYFEEYPHSPTGVFNGFMAALISIWELNYWLKMSWLDNLWQLGIHALHAMLPYYTLSWWSLYDHDEKTPVKNINSPRYHLLELHYLQILSLLTDSNQLLKECKIRSKQYHQRIYRYRAFGQKLLRKIIYK